MRNTNKKIKIFAYNSGLSERINKRNTRIRFWLFSGLLIAFQLLNPFSITEASYPPPPPGDPVDLILSSNPTNVGVLGVTKNGVPYIYNSAMEFTWGDTVTISATPDDSQYTFSHWSGDYCSSTPSVQTIVLDVQVTQCVANFVLKSFSAGYVFPANNAIFTIPNGQSTAVAGDLIGTATNNYEKDVALKIVYRKTKDADGNNVSDRWKNFGCETSSSPDGGASTNVASLGLYNCTTAHFNRKDDSGWSADANGVRKYYPSGTRFTFPSAADGVYLSLAAGTYEWAVQAELDSGLNSSWVTGRLFSIVPTPETPVAVTSVQIDSENFQLKVGAFEVLTAAIAPADASNKNVTWSSSDSAVAAINSRGQITGLSAGTSTITVTTEDGSRTDTVVVTVVPASVSYHITSDTKARTIDGATIDFGSTTPSNLGDGFDLSVATNDSTSHPLPENKSILKVYDITPSKTLEGTYSASISLTYPVGQVYKEGDTVMYWNGSSWSSEGISVFGHSEDMISFTTNHFSEFAIVSTPLSSGTEQAGNNQTGNAASTLPVTGGNFTTNFLLAIFFSYLLSNLFSRKRTY